MAAVREVQQDTELLQLRYRLSGTWSDGTVCRYALKDPNKGQDKPARLQTDPLPASLRLLRLWPGDPEPALGATIAYQTTGTLVLGLWSDESVWTGQRVGICRLVDERVYPVQATLRSGAQIRLRIVALGGPALSAQGLSASPNDSHRGHLPPGIQLTPGEVLTTWNGDHYQIVPPVQRDALGDTVGLSWLGQGALPPELPGVPSPDPTSPVNPADPDDPTTDGWWNEGLP